jgi:transcriptional regulator with XRE-family HTH domain
MAQRSRPTNGRKIAELRVAKGWALDALANTAGLTKRTVITAEHGGPVDLSSILSISEALGVEPSELMLPEADKEEEESNKIVAPQPAEVPSRQADGLRKGRARLLAATCIIVAVVLLAILISAGFIGRGPVFSAPALLGNPQTGWQQMLILRAEGWPMSWFRPRSGTEPIQSVWTDIYWDGPDGWLCGGYTGGGGGDIGKGVLLRTTDRGASWSQVDTFRSGRGGFDFGPFKGPDQYTWQDNSIGGIRALKAHPRNLAGPKRHELWLAAAAGVFHSIDDGKTWVWSTPKPNDTPKANDHEPPVPYAHFLNLIYTGQFEDVYAVGWQGIAHWNRLDPRPRWEVQLKTGSYEIDAVFAYPAFIGSADLWAVGHSEKPDSYKLIYHYLKDSGKWEPVLATGIELALEHRVLLDIVLVDDKTGFAVGPEGVIVQGSKGKDGTWAWAGLKNSPTRQDLYSIAYDNGDHTLWIVGSGGTVLKSANRGQDWNASSLKDERDERGRPPTLLRVRIFDSPWIVGQGAIKGSGVVYTYRRP